MRVPVLRHKSAPKFDLHPEITRRALVVLMDETVIPTAPVAGGQPRFETLTFEYRILELDVGMSGGRRGRVMRWRRQQHRGPSLVVRVDVRH